MVCRVTGYSKPKWLTFCCFHVKLGFVTSSKSYMSVGYIYNTVAWINVIWQAKFLRILLWVIHGVKGYICFIGLCLEYTYMYLQIQTEWSVTNSDRVFFVWEINLQKNIPWKGGSQFKISCLCLFGCVVLCFYFWLYNLLMAVFVTNVGGYFCIVYHKQLTHNT
jgi:hypothetical protein